MTGKKEQSSLRDCFWVSRDGKKLSYAFPLIDWLKLGVVSIELKIYYYLTLWLVTGLINSVGAIVAGLVADLVFTATIFIYQTKFKKQVLCVSQSYLSCEWAFGKQVKALELEFTMVTVENQFNLVLGIPWLFRIYIVLDIPLTWFTRILTSKFVKPRSYKACFKPKTWFENHNGSFCIGFSISRDYISYDFLHNSHDSSGSPLLSFSNIFSVNEILHGEKQTIVKTSVLAKGQTLGFVYFPKYRNYPACLRFFIAANTEIHVRQRHRGHCDVTTDVIILDNYGLYPTTTGATLPLHIKACALLEHVEGITTDVALINKESERVAKETLVFIETLTKDSKRKRMDVLRELVNNEGPTYGDERFSGVISEPELRMEDIHGHLVTKLHILRTE